MKSGDKIEKTAQTWYPYIYENNRIGFIIAHTVGIYIVCHIWLFGKFGYCLYIVGYNGYDNGYYDY